MMAVGRIRVAASATTDQIFNKVKETLAISVEQRQQLNDIIDNIVFEKLEEYYFDGYSNGVSDCQKLFEFITGRSI